MSHAFGGQKVVANFSNKPLERITLLEKKPTYNPYSKLLKTL